MKNLLETKFHEGDWITDGNITIQIEAIKNNCYLYCGDCALYSTKTSDKVYHLWTIADAKPGDILFLDLMDGKTFIYNGVNSDEAILYSFIISNDGEDVLPYHIGKPNTGIGNIEENKNIIHPATKEQCAILFAKMKEAGYEWDEDNKKLRKIEQQPTWIEEDEKIN